MTGEADLDAIRKRNRKRRGSYEVPTRAADIEALCDEVERLRSEAILNARYMGQMGADLAIAEHEVERLRTVLWG